MPKDSPEVVIQRMIDRGASPEVIREVAKEMANQQKAGNAASAYVPRQITPVTDEQFIPAGDRNIFNQDISTSFKQGAGGVYQAGKNLVGGVANMVIDPVKRGYEASNPFVTLGDLLNAPKKLLSYGALASIPGIGPVTAAIKDLGMQGAKDLREKSKNAKSMSEKLAYGALSPVPLLGPAIASVGEQSGSGNPEQMGEATFNALLLLANTPSFRAMSSAAKAEAIAAVKSGVSRIPVPAIAKKTILNVVENPGVALTGAYGGYKEGGTVGAVIGALGAPSGYNSALKLFGRKTAAEIAEERTYAEGRVAERRTYAEGRVGEGRTYAEGRVGEGRTYAEGQLEKKNLRQDTNTATKRQQTLDDRVSTAEAGRERLIEREAQAYAVLAEGREYTETLLQRKLARDAETAAINRKFREADVLSRDGKTAQIRADALAERQTATEQRVALTEKYRAEDRAFKVSDTAERYSRQDARAEEFKAAQKAEVHEKNIKAAAAATTAEELKAAKDLSNYYIQLAKNLDVNQKYALTQELEKAVAATQARLTQGLEAEAPVMTQRSTSVKDGTKTTVSQRFTQPPPDVAEPVPEQPAPAQSNPAPSTTPRQPATRADAPVADAAAEPDIFKQLRDQADAEGVPVTMSLEERQIAPEMARIRELASKRIKTLEEWAELDRLRKVRDKAVEDISKTYNAAGTPAGYVKVTDPVTGKVTEKLNTGGGNPRRGP